MIRFWFICLVSICLAGSARSQQLLPITSQYMMNRLLVNPAYAGSTENAEMRLMSRNQWVGIDGAPVTNTFSAHGMLKNVPLGVGAYVFSDQVGPTTQLGIQTSVAYHFDVSYKSRLSLGLEMGAFQYKIDGNKLSLDQSNDEAINKIGVQSKILPDASFGAYFYTGKMYVGAAVPHLLGNQVDLTGYTRSKVSRLQRHYLANAGAYLSLNNEIMLEPSAMFRYVPGSPLSIDVGAKLHYNNTLYTGVAWRPNDAIIVLLGVKFNNRITAAYSYDFTTSALSSSSHGTHEFLLGYDFPYRNARKLKPVQF